MPVTPTYPGVYIEEVPSGVRSIVGVSTSIAAFVGFFPRGPLDYPVRVLSMADFERDFGGLHERSEAGYAVRQFFLNGGSRAYLVRVGAGAIATADVTVAAGGTNLFRVFAGRQGKGDSRESPGGWGNGLRIDVDHDVVLPGAGVDPDGVQTLDELFNLTLTETAVRGGRTVLLQTETFRNLTLREGARNSVFAVVNEGSRLVQLAPRGAGWGPVPAAPNNRPAASGTLGAPLPTTVSIPPDGPASAFDVTVTDSSGSITYAATLDYGGTSPATYAALRRFVQAAIRAAVPSPSGSTPPSLTAATVRLESGRYRVLLGRSHSDYEPASQVSFADGAGTTASALGLAGGGVSVHGQQIPLAGGNDGSVPTSTALIGLRSTRTGFYALEEADLFNILSIPAAAGLPADQMRAVYGEAAVYCEERRSFLLVDIPETTDSVEDMETWLTDNATLRHENAAVYFPRPRIANPLDQNRLREVGASGTMAGLFARTDSERGVWKAPAGTDSQLRGVQALAVVLTDRENGVLNPLGANCLRNFEIHGNVAWGARTLDGADAQGSEWKYVPVRRIALFLEESLYRGTQWVVFEPNDEPLWSQIRLNVGAFMNRLFRQGAFQGAKPSDAYFVKCDQETTTQSDRDAGIVNILVGFAPLKPAEFVIIKISQIAGDIPT